MYKEIISVYCGNHNKLVNSLCNKMLGCITLKQAVNIVQGLKGSREKECERLSFPKVLCVIFLFIGKSTQKLMAVYFVQSINDRY